MAVVDFDTVAEKILQQTKKAVCRELPPFIRAVNSLNYAVSDNDFNYTDGNTFYYSPKFICESYKRNKNVVTRILLHSLLHCSLVHIYNTDLKNKKLWNLACDICVEKIINEAKIQCSETEKTGTQQSVIKNLSLNIKNFTAENIYYYLVNSEKELSEIDIYTDLFSSDNHISWYDNALFSIDNDEEFVKIETSSIYKREDDTAGETKEGSSSSKSDTLSDNAENSRDTWEDTAKKILRDFDVFSSQIGTESGNCFQLLNTVIREKYDYSDLLKMFICNSETIDINYDEFDYIYYTYGLKLYDNLPLIEPLEYSENSKIKKLVIAIDTSGSVKGDIVEGFMRKTYTILQSTDFFTENFEIHIIQCDAQIQNVTVVKNKFELEEYMDNLVLHGFGGTDFSPVFDYVDKLYEKSTENNIDGLIYFTDGDGIYPKNVPKYKNAFVINDNGFDKKRMPRWATALYIDKNSMVNSELRKEK